MFSQFCFRRKDGLATFLYSNFCGLGSSLHWESVRPVFALCHEFEIFQTGPVPRGTTLACIINFMRTIQMFRAHLKAHTRRLAFFLTKETPTHERTAVQTFVCVLLAV